MECNSFFKILIIDDELNQLTNYSWFLEVIKLPIIIEGIDDIKTLENKSISLLKTKVFNRAEMSFVPLKCAFETFIEYDIIILDYHLSSETTGIEIIKNLASHYKSRIPNILLIANYFPTERNECEITENLTNDLIDCFMNLTNRFDYFFKKDDSPYKYLDYIYRIAEDKYNIDEFICFYKYTPFEFESKENTRKCDKIEVEQIECIKSKTIDSTTQRKLPFNIESASNKINCLNFRTIPKVSSRIWISKEKEQIAFITYNNNELHNFIGKDYYQKISKSDKYKIDIFDEIHNNIKVKVISNAFSFRKAEIKSYFSKDEEHFPEEYLNKGNQRREYTISLSSVKPAGSGLEIEFELDIIMKSPEIIDFGTLIYKKGFENLSDILINDRYSIDGEISEYQFWGIKVAKDYEYYHLTIRYKKNEKRIFDKESILSDVGKIIYHIFSYTKSCIRYNLDRNISIFDLIGPDMVGPSSSHTCGANRIGRVANRIIKLFLKNKKTEKIYLSSWLLGSFKATGEGHRTVNALAAGLLEDRNQTDEDIAHFNYFPLDKKYNYDAIKVNWLGYRNMFPINENDDTVNLKISEYESIFGENNSKLHSNTAIIFADSEFNYNFDKNKHELIIIGESLGGGKIQIKAIGTNNEKMQNIILNDWKWESKFKIDGTNIFLRKTNSEIPLLDGNNNFHYNAIPNISSYRTEIKSIKDKIGLQKKTVPETLSFFGFDDLKEFLEKNPHWDLLDAVFMYENWHLNVPIHSNEFNQLIRLEAQRLHNTMVRSAREIIKFSTSENLEKRNIINTYQTILKIKPKNIFEAASNGAITAMTGNALSRLILAAPTGGASGILPGVHEGLKFYLNSDLKSEEEIKICTDAFLIAGLFGAISSKWVAPSGARFGCQAETGTGAGMGAVYACKILGGTDEQLFHAFILAIKNSLGLVCDPLAGGVNIPCIKRNAFKAVEALNSAFISLMGVQSLIPLDEVMSAMREIGNNMQGKYKETSKGGLATTPIGLEHIYCNKCNAASCR